MGVISRVLAMFLTFLSTCSPLSVVWLSMLRPNPRPLVKCADAGERALLVTVAAREVTGLVQNITVDA